MPDLSVPALLPPIDALLRTAGGARVVGGAVRDLLLGRTPKDVDVATPAMPEDVLARAAAAGLRTIPTGLQHGTVTIVLADGPAVEVTTLRTDAPGALRAAAARFGAGWAEDAARRDLTINALFLDADGRIHDHVGGLEDLARRHVRFVGDPRARLGEDPLRALRFFRVAARLGDARLDPAGLAACPETRISTRRLPNDAGTRPRPSWPPAPLRTCSPPAPPPSPAPACRACVPTPTVRPRPGRIRRPSGDRPCPTRPPRSGSRGPSASPAPKPASSISLPPCATATAWPSSPAWEHP